MVHCLSFNLFCHLKERYLAILQNVEMSKWLQNDALDKHFYHGTAEASFCADRWMSSAWIIYWSLCFFAKFYLSSQFCMLATPNSKFCFLLISLCWSFKMESCFISHAILKLTERSALVSKVLWLQTSDSMPGQSLKLSHRDR